MSPKKKRYSEDFRKQLILECQETGNISLVARRQDIHLNTLNGWLKRLRETGSVSGVKAEDADIRELSKQLNQVSEENDILKRLMNVNGLCCNDKVRSLKVF
ncbi:MAG: transposase [Firmicutes bacterium]|nr:transposase [Bacillota bacterium]MDD4693824.1 transposase [Bacillota bacterium]